MDRDNIASYFELQDDPLLSGKLSALYTFMVVSQYTSLRTAAQKLYISPQVLNRQITALEEKLGLPLLERTPRGFSLTSYGESVFEYSSALFRSLQQFRRDLNAMHAENNHLLRLAYSNNLYDTSLHMYMMDFQGEQPNCKMKSMRRNFDQTMELAHGNEPFITLTTRPANTENFDVTILHDAHYYALVHKENPLSKLSGLDISDFDETPLILCSEFFRANQYLLKHCTEQKLSVNVRLETGGFQSGLELCRQNKGALLMADYIEDQIDSEGLVKVAPKGGLFSLELVMLVRKDLEYSQMEHKFIEYMKAYSPELN
jgi:Transcriptional regulator